MQTVERTAAAPALSRRDEIAIAIFGSWMVAGLYLDGWAHEAAKPETFFSPWHGVLYSGFGAAVAFFVISGWRSRGQPRASDRLASAGLALFVAGALGDGVWHEIFGIEADIEALLSPTHLALMTGGLLMLGAPVRAALVRSETSPSWRSFAPTVVALTLAAAVVSFFLLYLSAFHVDLDTFRGDAGDLETIWGIASVFTSNLILLGVAAFTARRWRTPFGTFTLMFAAVAAFGAGLHAFREAVFVIPAALGGLTADAITARTTDPVRGSRLVGGLVPLVLWGSWFAVLAAAYGLAWTPELWTGTIAFCALAGIGLSLVSVGTRSERVSVSAGTDLRRSTGRPSGRSS